MSRRTDDAAPRDELRERIQRHLKRLGLNDFDLEAHLRWAREAKASDLQSIERLLAAAAAFKIARSIEWRFGRSGLKVKKTMAGFDWDFQPKLDRRAVEALFDLSFVGCHDDVLLTGKTGTGKSHILQSLVLKACEHELAVRYARCVDLVDDLYAGLADGTYEKRMKAWCRVQLLVIDDVGLGQLKRRDDEPTAAHMLFTLLDRRHMTASTAITSNLQLSAWGKYLGDATLAGAVLDRLAATAIRIDIDGPSYRQHLARQRADAQSRTHETPRREVVS
ncbi:MAG: ATP-binding protein [Deltaproteobacteria bacterium]|nr:ATP-binding protein [Deltaproteobacteria bacterium]